MAPIDLLDAGLPPKLKSVKNAVTGKLSKMRYACRKKNQKAFKDWKELVMGVFMILGKAYLYESKKLYSGFQVDETKRLRRLTAGNTEDFSR